MADAACLPRRGSCCSHASSYLLRVGVRVGVGVGVRVRIRVRVGVRVRIRVRVSSKIGQRCVVVSVCMRCVCAKLTWSG